MVGRFVGEVEIDDNLRGLELMFEQRERVANDLIQIGFAEFGGRSAREVQQAVGNF